MLGPLGLVSSSPLVGQIALKLSLLNISAAGIITLALPSSTCTPDYRSHAWIFFNPSRKGVIWATGLRQEGFQAWKSLILLWARDIFKLDFEKAR